MREGRAALVLKQWKRRTVMSMFASQRTSTKPSIVFAHGIWADGSCFSKVIPMLQAEGYEVLSSQYGLDTPEGDVEAVRHTLGRVSSPAILVGHPYGGLVLPPPGND